ncbi:MAG TPA: FAD-dependent tricarballylate dehydrogenase TcuA [Burkholderiales bacterium]|jgi:tricarballylate dehydrogenase|nr:FAD-dependent tricarballylate dehydrogenase TcuA [Burkholderiales bacterium]
MNNFDVIVVGGGNAAFAAAVSAKEHGAKRVVVLEKAPKAQRGGNTHFSGAIFRHYFNDVKELDRFVPDTEEKYPGFHTDCEPYTKDDFRADLMRVTNGRSDPELATILIDESYDTMCWIQEKGRMHFELAHSVMGIRVGGKVKWPKGALVRVSHEGVGLSKTWFETAEAMGIEVRYDTSAMRLSQGESGRVDGVVARGPDGIATLNAKAVVLAAGGFETNPAWRRLYLGDPWDHAKVRGSNFNYGDGLKMAMDIGAMPWGHWGGCHATPINAEAPDYGRRDMTDKTNRLSYTYGVMINTEGKRWVDEGADFNSYTYAKYGGAILKQPGSLIYQIFDSKVLEMLEPRYSTSVPFKSDTLEGLVKQLKVDHEQAVKTLNEYNAAAGHGKFNPIALDGLHTEGIEPAKTNWAQKLDAPPYVAYPVTGGITFTFGGLKITKDAQVVSSDWKPMPGLYTCGEMVGGLFHYNYPLGTGLMSGAVFGRIAGRSAAQA